MSSNNWIVGRIREAFKDTIRPKVITIKPQQKGDCLEIERAFSLMDWESVSETFLQDHGGGAVAFFSLAGFAYFLPAFLISILNSAAFLNNNTAHSALVRLVEPAGRSEQITLRQMLTPRQRAVVRSVFEALIQDRSYSEYRSELESALREVWSQV